ncbi:MAG: tetratricopeptide repeat protein [Bacteroidia bacterium]|nr:MAG: tetratricopeptide repeat protein [Bacteroidia bacterium]
MPQSPGRLSRFWRELKRRKVLRSLAIYAGTAFIILEASSIIFPLWNFPGWSINLVLWLLILGAFINVIIAWIYDITPGGMRRTKPMEELTPEDRVPDSRGWKAATYISLVVIVALVIFNVIGPTETLRAGDIQSLLVLPFDNFTGDDQLDYVAAGMHSSLIGDMGRISGLRIISKTTANIYKNMAMSLPDIATELNADVIVEPTVMCYGDSVCIQIRVITPFPEEKQIWIGEYKEEKSQILNLYNRVTKQIAEEIKISLTPSEIEALAETRIVNTEAYDAYMKGQYYWDQLTPEALQMAMEYFNKAIEIDPDWAPPYAGIAAFWMGVRQMGLAPSSITVPNIYKYLNKTIELDPNSALTHYTTAGAAVWTGYDWEKGEREFLKVIELNPNAAENRAYYAHLLLFLKRHDEALTQAQLALALDPLNPMIQGFVAVVHWHIGNYERAIELANQILQLVPNHPLAIGVLWGANDLLGNYEESIHYCVKLFGLDEENSALVLDTFKEQGYKAALGKLISIVETIPDEQIPVSAATRIAWMYLQVDNTDEALSILEKELEEQAADLPYVTTGIDHYKELESEPRFLAILEKMGLPLPRD